MLAKNHGGRQKRAAADWARAPYFVKTSLTFWALSVTITSPWGESGDSKTLLGLVEGASFTGEERLNLGTSGACRPATASPAS